MMGRQGADAARLITRPMIGLVAVLATLPLWIGKIGLYPYIGVEILIFALYAMAFNLLLGYGGLPSFGHGALFGMGAYAFGLFQLNVAANLWLCLAVATGAGALAGALVGAFISHRRGIYYALLTIAFGQVFWFIAIKWHSVTGGEDGLLKIQRLPVDFLLFSLPLEGNVALFYFVLTAFAVALVGLWRLVNSPFGRVLQAIKQNEARAAFVGYDVWRYKFTAFVLSAAVSGFAGGLFAMAQRSAFPDVMSLHYSGFVVMMTLVGGGLVSFWGPLIGAAVFLLARDVLGALTTTWMLWFGLLFMAIVLFRPEGIAGWWQEWRGGAARSARPAGWARLRLLWGK